jgi:flagellin-like hook-associated protein FlgL
MPSTPTGAAKQGGPETVLSALRETIGRDIEPMVNTGMDEEATRQQALQLQAELAIQVLSIANTSTRSILALFR